MRKFLIALLAASSTLFGQYTPPGGGTSAPATVTFDPATGKFKSPSNWAAANSVFTHDGAFRFNNYTSVIAANNLVTATGGQLPYLTPGAGLSGQPYNGSQARAWSVSLQSLNFGEGLVSGSYNGLAGKTAAINTAWFDARVSEVSPFPSQPRIRISTMPRIAYLNGTKIDFFTGDAELKDMSESGTFEYWGSTLGNKREPSYAKNPKRDPGVQSFFACADIPTVNPRTYIPFEPKIFDSVGEQARYMAATATQPEINGIIIEPDVTGRLVDGTPVSSIFNPRNADLRPVTLAFDEAGAESTLKGNPKWRLAELTWQINKMSKPKGYRVLLDNEQFESWTNGKPTGWNSGIRFEYANQITSGLPPGYTSGMRLKSFSSAFVGWTGSNALLYRSDTVLEAGKKYHILVGVWLRKGPAAGTNWNASLGWHYTSVLNTLKATGGYGNLVTAKSEWQYYISYKHYTATARYPMGIGSGQECDWTGLTVIIWEDEGE